MRLILGNANSLPGAEGDGRTCCGRRLPQTSIQPCSEQQLPPAASEARSAAAAAEPDKRAARTEATSGGGTPTASGPGEAQPAEAAAPAPTASWLWSAPEICTESSRAPRNFAGEQRPEPEEWTRACEGSPNPGRWSHLRRWTRPNRASRPNRDLDRRCIQRAEEPVESTKGAG